MKNSKYIFYAQHLLRTCIAAGTSLAISSAAWAGCTYTVTNNWGSGFTAEIKVTNDTGSTVNNWSVSWQESGASITSAWNANFSGSNPYTATSLSWNSTLAPGASASFGLQGNGTAGTPAVSGSLCGGTSTSSKSSSISSSRSSSISSSIISSRSSSVSSSSRSSSSVVISSSKSSSSSSSSAAGVSLFTIQEEQSGFCRVDGIATESTNAGFTGNGYTNANNAQGAGIVWAVNATTSARYTLTFRYANGGTNARNGSLLINSGANGNYTIQLPSTSGWTNWQTASVEIDLVQGNNILQLSALTSDGLANIDSLQIEGASSKAGTCPAVSSSSSSTSSSASSRSSSVSRSWP